MTNPFFFGCQCITSSLNPFQFFLIPMKTKYLNVSAVRKLVKGQGKRVSQDFLLALDRLVERKVLQATQEHNGGKKTLDSAVAAYILGNGG